jgi:ABC-type phosphate/phosphonate transport system substrate-binding protein
MAKRLTLSYYPWITQSKTPDELRQAIGKFVDLLNRELGNELRIDAPVVLDVPGQLADIKVKPAGDVAGKIGLLNPLGYAMAHQEVPEVVAIAVVRRKSADGVVGPTYKAQLYAHRRAAISKIEQVSGRTIAFGVAHSTSNFLLPAVTLFQNGTHPLTGLARVHFAGGHPEAARAVYEGDVEIGAGHDGVIIDLATRPGYGDANDVLQRIVWTAPIPSDPVAIHAPDAAVREHVTKALLRIAKPKDAGSAGNLVVKDFWSTDQGFETTKPNAYDELFAYTKLLALRPGDILR